MAPATQWRVAPTWSAFTSSPLPFLFLPNAYRSVIILAMEFNRSTEPGLDYLLGLDGNIEFQNDEGYWVKMEVRRATVSSERPHGIRYS